jgi:hypothetical protein
MSNHNRFLRLVALGTAVAFLNSTGPEQSRADDGVVYSTPVIVQVEEDWELLVGEPNVLANAPQVSMVMTPFANIEGYHFLALLNLRTHPDYRAGGLQVQLWNGESLVSYHNSPQEELLHHTGETVAWTQRMQLSGGNVVFSIVDGLSASWGNFGGQGYLVASFPSTIDNLISYNPYVTLNESGITFAGNRVSSLTLKQIRWITDSGQVYSVSAPIDIDTDLDPWN